jgi:hypothetical protein
VLEGKDKDKDAKIKIKMRTVTINYKFLRSEYLMPNNPGPQLPICPHSVKGLSNLKTREPMKTGRPFIRNATFSGCEHDKALSSQRTRNFLGEFRIRATTQDEERVTYEIIVGLSCPTFGTATG